ncbi:DUF5803 family protein [Halorubrum laminariae]|uniref:DUF5803 family protein n=1 Tax=Halorubrum laminariae TaxID=1433523 RepID=A0ABD6BW27_9EURY|nr:DUF5803 family protein [Halorubrum laminariae]
MNRRFALAVAVVALLAVSAGCLTYVNDGGDVANATLDTEPPSEYEFATDRDAAFNLSTGTQYTAVYNVSGVEELRLYRQTPYAGDQPLEFEAFRYRTTDGEVLNGTEFRAAGGEVERTPDETWIRFDDGLGGGQVAFSATGSPRRFTTLTYVEGSYAVTLPPGFSTEFPVVGHVSPRDYEVETVGDRDRVVWDDVTSGSVVVQSYRETDLLVFGVILAVAILAAIVGTVYFRRQLEALRERRREMGLGEYDDEK